MTIDLQSEAVAFARKHGLHPASLVQKAMERGAELMAKQATELIRQNHEELNQRRKEIERGTQHGHLNGHLQL